MRGRPVGSRNKTVAERLRDEVRKRSKEERQTGVKAARKAVVVLTEKEEESRAAILERQEKRLRALFEKAWLRMHKDPISPLDALIWTMHVGIERRDIPIILSSASAAAPYIHPKLTSSEVRVTNRTAKQMSDAELVAEVQLLQQRVQLSSMRLAAAGAQEALDGVAEPMEAETPDPPPEGLQQALEPEESR